MEGEATVVPIKAQITFNDRILINFLSELVDMEVSALKIAQEIKGKIR